jgi:hypothetical protein
VLNAGQSLTTSTGDIDIAVYAVWPTVQKNDRTPIGGPGLRVSGVQDACLDLFQGAERHVCVPGLVADSCTEVAALDCAYAEPIPPSSAAAMVTAAVPKKRRR